MTIVLFDTPISRLQLFPFTLTRPVAKVLHGVFTGLSWYGYMSNLQVAELSEGALAKPMPPDSDYLCVDASVIPTQNLFKEIMELPLGEMLEDEHGMIAYHINNPPKYGSLPIFLKGKSIETRVERIQHPMDWVKTNAEKIAADISLIKDKHLTALKNNNGNQIFGSHPVWVSVGVKVQGCTFNTEDGPVYIGHHANLMEGSIIRGPAVIGIKSVIKMGAQIYGGTTIGYKCTAGGEIKNSILSDFSNKAHHGYLGDSIVGQWCNLGAGTTNSNVKNNAGTIYMWNGLSKTLVPIGQKAGMVMGDYTKTAINTSINSGTTIGAGCSIHHSGLTDKVIPSFTWGMAERYEFQKLKRDIEHWMAFKHETPQTDWWHPLHELYVSMPNPYDENHG